MVEASATSSSRQQRQLLRAAMVVDGDGRRFAPGALLIHNNNVIAAGSPQHIGRSDDVFTRNYEKFVLTPGLANAHAHLDLTHIGPEPATYRINESTMQRNGGGFVDWVNRIRAARAVHDEDIRASVSRGAALARIGGTAFVGDIAGVGSIAAVEALRESGLPGVSYVEVFGIGKRQPRGIEMIAQVAEKTATYDRGVQVGIQPHAPYSAGPEVYRAAAESGLPLSTHLAELTEEIEFSKTGGGPMRELSQQLGVWDETAIGVGKHPVDALAEVLQNTPCVAAHLNYIDDAHIELLANWPISVAYCPRASAYFGHQCHRYCDMFDAGVNVCLGTDSIVCLGRADRISVLDDMRFLYQRDGTDPQALLRMATINGAKALGVDPQLLSFSEGKIAGVLAVEIDETESTDPLRQMLLNDRMPVWVSTA